MANLYKFGNQLLLLVIGVSKVANTFYEFVINKYIIKKLGVFNVYLLESISILLPL